MSQKPRDEAPKAQPPKAQGPEATRKPKLEPPKVITYSGDDILEELGPAHACNPFSGSVVAC
jgi:hypothetical protein